LRIATQGQCRLRFVDYYDNDYYIGYSCAAFFIPSLLSKLQRREDKITIIFLCLPHQLQMTINEGLAMVLLFLLQDVVNCLSVGLGCALEWELHQRLSY
jgi:hypothetical protein